VIAATPPPARVQVVAQEFRFALSRRTIKAGHAIIELRNAGEDAHDLLIQRVGGRKIWAWPVTQAGAVADRNVVLRPGTYRLWCGVANHGALGMRATLIVKKSSGISKRG
jgi:plastocyanin